MPAAARQTRILPAKATRTDVVLMKTPGSPSGTGLAPPARGFTSRARGSALSAVGFSAGMMGSGCPAKTGSHETQFTYTVTVGFLMTSAYLAQVAPFGQVARTTIDSASPERAHDASSRDLEWSHRKHTPSGWPVLCLPAGAALAGRRPVLQRGTIL